MPFKQTPFVSHCWGNNVRNAEKQNLLLALDICSFDAARPISPPASPFAIKNNNYRSSPLFSQMFSPHAGGQELDSSMEHVIWLKSAGGWSWSVLCGGIKSRCFHEDGKSAIKWKAIQDCLLPHLILSDYPSPSTLAPHPTLVHSLYLLFSLLQKSTEAWDLISAWLVLRLSQVLYHTYRMGCKTSKMGVVEERNLCNKSTLAVICFLALLRIMLAANKLSRTAPVTMTPADVWEWNVSGMLP